MKQNLLRYIQALNENLKALHISTVWHIVSDGRHKYIEEVRIYNLTLSDLISFEEERYFFTKQEAEEALQKEMIDLF